MRGHLRLHRFVKGLRSFPGPHTPLTKLRYGVIKIIIYFVLIFLFRYFRILLTLPTNHLRRFRVTFFLFLPPPPPLLAILLAMNVNAAPEAIDIMDILA